MRMNVRIVTDSTCDLPEEIASQHSVTVIPLAINVGDKTFLDGVALTRSEFYAQLPNFNPHPKTAAPGPEVFARAFARLAIDRRASHPVHPYLRNVERHCQLGAHRRAAVHAHSHHRAGFGSTQPRSGIHRRARRAVDSVRKRTAENHLRLEQSDGESLRLRIVENARISAPQWTDEFCAGRIWRAVATQGHWHARICLCLNGVEV